MSDRAYTDLVNSVLKLKYDRRTVMFGEDVVFRGFPHISVSRGSSIAIGRRSYVVSSNRWTPLGLNHAAVLRTLSPNGRIEIGSDVGVSGATICAVGEVLIGDRCLIGANVVIADTDFHPVDDLERRYKGLPPYESCHRVVIGDDVFVGMGALILKGVSIGRGSVVAAGSVVVSDVPELSVVGGNPARLLRKLRTELQEAQVTREELTN